MGLTETDIVIAVFACTLILLLLAAFGIIFTLLYKKKQQANKKEKQLMEASFRQNILQTQVEIQDISQEIHDNIGQVLSLAKLNLNSCAEMEDEGTQCKINATKQLIGKAIRDLRDISRSMHGDKIAELGLEASISSELKILQNSGQYITSLQVVGLPYRLEPNKEMVIFRIVQEGLNNVIKHARANNIDVNFEYAPHAFSLLILDNGIGFNPASQQAPETGIGLINMRNRAALIGAELFVDSKPGNGTQVSIKLKNLVPAL